MARYSRSYSSYRSGSYHGGGFTNSRTGSYVSPARAHQHTGQDKADNVGDTQSAQQQRGKQDDAKHDTEYPRGISDQGSSYRYRM